MDEELKRMVTYLGLRGLITNWDHYLDIAKKSSFSSVKLLSISLNKNTKSNRKMPENEESALQESRNPLLLRPSLLTGRQS